MKKPKRLSRKVIYKSEWINLYVDKVKLPDERIVPKYHFIDIERPGVSVIVENQRQEILFVNVYRYHFPLSGRLPAGRLRKVNP